MGDAGSATLIEREHGHSHFQLYSDGSGERALYIPNSGSKKVSQDKGLPSLLKMDGAQVFDFTLRRVPPMIDSILRMAGLSPLDINYFVLHQPNKYILSSIQKKLGIDDRCFPKETQAVFGNQNSASIPGTISGFLSDHYRNGRIISLLSGFGIGLSWGHALLKQTVSLPLLYF